MNRPLTAAQLADALGYFSNTAITAMHGNTATEACIAQGIDAVACRLAEIATENETQPTAFDTIGSGVKALEPFLTIAALQRAHVERQEEWCPDQKPDLSFRGNEMAGEVGEACNVIKKLERERHGWRGSRATTDDLGDELADVVHTAVLCAITAGIELGPRVVAKFNATSEKNGLATLLSTHTAAGAGPVGEAVAVLPGIKAFAEPDGGYTLRKEYACINGLTAWFTLVTVHARDKAEIGYTDGAIHSAEEILRSLYARPVDEPGEVERLTADNLRLQNEWDNCDEILQSVRSALAETRKALSRLLNAQAPFKVRRGESRLDASDRHQKERAEAAQYARAALTGDAQEAGR